MPQREPKTIMSLELKVKGRNGSLKGTIHLTSGNITYYRANAKTSTVKLTYQQLIDLLEKSLEDHSA